MNFVLALVLSGLPCGVTEADKPCESSAGVPRGVQCFENGGAGSLIGSYETKWIEPRTCSLGSLVLTTARGSADASYTVPELPPGATRNAKLQAAITAALIPPAQDPKNPQHALAVLKSQLPTRSDALIPEQPWWPGPVARQTNSSRPTNESFDGIRTCPCVLRFDAERFSKVREWKVGAQTISMWAYLHVNRGEFAFAVTDEGDKRHRWIHSHPNPRSEPEAHLEGTRWYLPMADGLAESFMLLGYDASTGEAWRVKVDGIHTAHATDAGVVLEGRGKPFTRSWASLGPPAR